MFPWLWLNHAKSILRVFAQTASADFFGPRSRKPRQLIGSFLTHAHTHQIQSIIEWAFQLILDRITANNLLANSQEKIPNRQTKSVSSRRSASHDMSWWIKAIRCIWVHLNIFESFWFIPCIQGPAPFEGIIDCPAHHQMFACAGAEPWTTTCAAAALAHVLLRLI